MTFPKLICRASAALLLLLCTQALAQDVVTEEIIGKPEAPKVRLETNYGDITLKMLPEAAPLTVANFLRYVDEGFYDGTIFHRVIRNFMIQGGGFDSDLVQKQPHDPIVNESKPRWRNLRGTAAMARTNDPDSASAQFFINLRINDSLDWAPGKAGYAVFAEVVDGMSVVDFIATAETTTMTGTTLRGPGQFADVPTETVMINRAVRVD